MKVKFNNGTWDIEKKKVATFVDAIQDIPGPDVMAYILKGERCKIIKVFRFMGFTRVKIKSIRGFSSTWCSPLLLNMTNITQENRFI